MGEDSRITALTTACDDLQAQLEAGDRSVRHVDHDLTEVGAILASVTEHTATLVRVLRHMKELRANMLEQRRALREVRAAATVLCTSLAKTLEKAAQLANEQGGFDERGARVATTAHFDEQSDVFPVQAQVFESEIDD